eukprot:gnl/Hemi2/4794_TR1661_c0_g1_i1.p1 gnl/Hemi2/4794_TR1661_c0_g1~~gnl/Hemi2/4794_TR1661_c0_g1_i1.p1  ORF type:complete len:480 (-),score=131.25 gnl/Hemi2/4794_TR1661_c0_g1_i1:131-1510(-)
MAAVAQLNGSTSSFDTSCLSMDAETEHVLKRLQAKAVVQMIRVGDFFKDFDQLRSGCVTPAQFRSVLKRCTFDLTDQEFDLLAKRYTKVNRISRIALISWRDFEFDMEQVEYDRTLVRAPTRSGTTRPPADELVRTLKPSNPAIPAAEAVMERFRAIAHHRRFVTIVPFFQDFDKLRHGFVTRAHFRQVLNNYLEMNFNNEMEFEAIARHYGSPDDARVVNYMAFAQDTCAPLEAYKPPKLAYDVPVTQRHRPLDELLYKMAQRVQHTRVRLIEFFKDHDPLRKGTMTSQKFRSALSMAKFVLTDVEYRLLEVEFLNPGPPPAICYTDLCDRLELIYSQHRVTKEPLRVPEDYNTIRAVELVSEGDKSDCAQILLALAENIKLRRLNVKPFLAAMDRQKTGRITKEQLVKVLAGGAVKLNFLTPHEIDTLFACFHDDVSNQFKYHLFMHEIERIIANLR